MEQLRNAPLLLHLSWNNGDPHGGCPGSSSQNGYEMFRLPHALGELQPCCSGGSVVWEAANVGSGSCSKKATVWRTSDGKSTAVMCALLVSVGRESKRLILDGMGRGLLAISWRPGSP